MIVTCQSCLQHYKLDESKVKPLGSKVQCGKCKAVFTVFPPDVEPIAEDITPLEPPPTPSTTQLPPPPTTQPPPPPPTTQTPPTTQAPPPPPTTQPPQVDTTDSTAEEEIPPGAGPDDVIIVMPGTEPVSDADSVVTEQDTVVFATSDADKKPIAEPEPAASIEADEEPITEPEPAASLGADEEPIAQPEPAAAFKPGEDPGPADVIDEPPKKLSEAEDEADHRPTVEEAPPKKGSFSIIFFLILLPAVIYGAIVYLDKKGYEMPWLEGLNLPYISQSSDSKQNLPHEMIVATDINSRFIRNNEGSPLFVISGKLTNQGEKAQQAVQVTGELFDEADSVLARKIVVGGRFLSDLDLIALSQGDIDQKLSAMNNAAQAPVIDVGASIPFMVVFYDIDDQLKEFSIKVTESEPAS